MSRIAWVSLARQIARAENGWRPLIAAVALGFALTLLSIATGHRAVQHMDEMARVPPEARLQVTASTRLPAEGARDVERDLAEIRAIPHVSAASWLEAPLRSMWYRPELFALGDRRIVGWVIAADDGVDDTLALTLVDGRLLGAGDPGPDGPVPIVVTRSFLAELGGGAWVGARVRSVERSVEAEVVGVVEDYLSHGEMRTSRNTVLWAARPSAALQATYLVRVADDGLAGVRAEIERRLAAPGRLVRVERMSDVVGESQSRAHRTQTVLHAIVAALVLTVLLGTVAVCAFRVVERRRQLGILRALGARRSDVALLVVAESTLSAAIGIALGLLLAYVLHGFLLAQIPFLEITPAMVVASALLFLGSSALAALVPAWMAARVPPSIASRGG